MKKIPQKSPLPSMTTALIAATLFGGMSAAMTATAADASSRKPGWSRTMQELNKTLSELMTDLSSDQRFSAPKNQARIEANAKKLANLAHDLKDGAPASPDQDPSVAMVGDLFESEAQRAYKSFKWGHKLYARELLRGMSSYCINCHTRTGSGPSFSSLPFNPSAADLKPSERGAFFAATRQYDRALEELQKVIDSAEAPGARPVEWTNSVRYALAIAVRVKRDPELALGIVDRAIQSKGSPFFFRQDAGTWRQTILDWRKEAPRKAPKEEGEESLRAEAIRLLAKAHDTQKYPADRSADILYLRASAAVHDLLQKAPKGKYAPEAHLMAGLCYDVLRPFRLGELHEVYYEGCVRQAPHTPLAESCYHRLEQSVIEGFTGTAGTDVPEEIRQKLKRLEVQALPESPAPSAVAPK